MRMSKANKAIAKRGTAFLLSCLLCFGGIATNWLGLLPGSSDGITAKMSAYATGGPAYEANQTYYDAGTFTLTGSEDGSSWNIENASSVLTGTDAVTLGNTTDVNTSATDSMSGQGFGDTNKNLSDYMAPVPSSETYQYIAKGTTAVDGDSIKISWDIKSWPQTSNAKSLPTTSAAIGNLWGTDGSAEYDKHAPEWVSGNEDYFQWSANGDYSNYVGTGQQSEFKYGSNFLVWDKGSGTGATTWDNNAWSVINTIPVQWGINQSTWADDTGTITADKHVAEVSQPKGISVVVNGKSGNLSQGQTNSVAGFTTPANLYTGGNDFAAYLNESGHHSSDGTMSSWTLPAYDTAGILYSIFADKNNGALAFLRSSLKDGVSVTKAVPGSTGFTPSSVTLDFDSDDNLGLRIYGIQSAVFANPGGIWYGLADEGKGGLAYRGDTNCVATGFSEDDMPWETGKYRYPAITNSDGDYLKQDSYVHAYMTDGKAAEFVWAIDTGDLVVGTNQDVGNVPDGIAGSNGILSYSDLSGSDSPVHKTRLYTGYDGNGYRINNTNLDGDDGEQTLVNSHVPMQVRSILYYDVTDDSMRATGSAEGSRIPDKVLLDITNTTASDKDGNLVAHDNTVIADVIQYEGLEAGKTYTLSGKVFEVTANNTLGSQVAAIGPWTLTANGTTTSANQVVTGNATVGTEGSLSVTFPGFNSATGDYGQKKYVVQQTLTDTADATNTDTHGDVTTTSQIVTYTYQQPGTPTLTTTAVSGTTSGSKLINPAVDDSIEDTVNWSGLEPGEYYIQGQLYDTAANTTVPNSAPVKSSNFTVNSIDDTGSFTMEFALTQDMLPTIIGKQVTVGQRLFKSDGTEVTEAAHVDMTDAAQTVTIQSPTIETDLVSATETATGSINAGTDKSGAPAATTLIADKVRYTGLVPGANYKCVTKIVYQDTGELLKSSDGKQSEFSKTFMAKGETASFTMGLKLTNMQNDLYGKQVVAFNELYWVVDGKEVLLKEEKDLKNGRQTFTFTGEPVVEPTEPTLDTLAEGVADNNSYSRTTVKNAENAGIRDTINYTGLTPGISYTLTGKVYNQATGKVIAGVDPVVQTFTPGSERGSVPMEFTLDTRALGGVKLVIGESLSVTDGELVVEHFDLQDEDQTLTVADPDVPVDPDEDEYIDTKAENGRGGKTIEAAKDTKIYDTVYYYNLLTGRTYKLEGEVREKTSGDKVGDIVEMEFTPEKDSGSVEMTFTVDTSKFGGKDLVVYETLSRNGETVTYHRDLSDADQTVHVNTPPNNVEDGKLTTVATDSRTGSHTLALSKEAGIRDIVNYEGLISGREYTLTTTVIDKQTGQAAAGTAAQSKKFTADGTSGSLTVTVPIDTTGLLGHTLVVYETVYYDGKVVCAHTDIDDANQTVTVGKISTILTGKNGGKTVPMANSTTLQDTISFEGLTPGRDYTITGYIIDVTGEASTETTSTTSVQAQTTQQPTATTTPAQTSDNQDGEASLNVGDDTSNNAAQPTTTPNGTDTTMEETIVIDEGRRQAGAQSVTLADGTKIEFSGELVATGTATFTPSAANGSVSIDFSVSTKGRNGHDLVCLEVITDNGVPIATHADLTDAQQTVSVRTSVNVQTGASPFGKIMTLISVLMMLGFGIYTASAVINRKKFEE